MLVIQVPYWFSSLQTLSSVVQLFFGDEITVLQDKQQYLFPLEAKWNWSRVPQKFCELAKFIFSGSLQAAMFLKWSSSVWAVLIKYQPNSVSSKNKQSSLDKCTKSNKTVPRTLTRFTGYWNCFYSGFPSLNNNNRVEMLDNSLCSVR